MPVRAIYVPLSAEEMKALRALGRREDRDLRRQAARMVREGLHRAGALAIEVTDYCDIKTAPAEPARTAAVGV
jgi:hypothetical protein